jgi:putative DNA primase/helicase
VTGPGVDDLDEMRRRLVAELELLAETLLGAPNRRASTRQQLRFGSHGSLAVELRRDRGTWFSHETGDGGGVFELIMFGCRRDFAGAVKWAREWLHMAPADRQATAAPYAVRETDEASERARNIALAASIWRDAVPLPGSLAEVYLTARGCAGDAPSALRFHPACPRGATERLPAMVALMTCAATGQPVGIHRTFLRADGSGKIEHGTAKMMLGAAGAVRLVSDENVISGLGICEGIETGLAIMQRAGWRPIWAATSSAGISKFPVLAGIEALTIFPDRDDKGAGVRAAEECATRWRAASREIRMIWPPDGTDWLDALAAAA